MALAPYLILKNQATAWQATVPGRVFSSPL